MKISELAIRLYCEQWPELIFVREKLQGRFTEVSLKDLPFGLREKWVRFFIRQGEIVPPVAK